MCGIFAFTGAGGPDPDLLVAVAAGAAQRGPHGHGWAGTGLTAHHRLGPLDPVEVRTVSASQILGHARLATIGAYNDHSSLQPVAAGGHLLAHNGTVYNAGDLWAGAGTDSVALAHAYAGNRRQGAQPAVALEMVVKQADHRAWVVVVLDASGELVAHRHRLPLWRYSHPSGVYLSSRPLPGAVLLAADTIHSEVVPWRA